jgi:hypothetical protein
MPEDSNSKPGTVTRLLKLTQDWTRETTKISGYFEQTKDLLQNISECNSDLKKKVLSMDQSLQEVRAKLLVLKSHCESAQKKAGVMGALEWMMKSAKEQPMAFALIFMTIMMFLILLTVLGYKLNLPSLLGG